MIAWRSNRMLNRMLLFAAVRPKRRRMWCDIRLNYTAIEASSAVVQFLKRFILSIIYLSPSNYELQMRKVCFFLTKYWHIKVNAPYKSNDYNHSVHSLSHMYKTTHQLLEQYVDRLTFTNDRMFVADQLGYLKRKFEFQSGSHLNSVLV